jgi:glycosyltransferase involved in cell wall biosynthesis
MGPLEILGPCMAAGEPNLYTREEIEIQASRAGCKRYELMSDSRKQGILMLVENLSVPFDRRVWREATTLRDAGYSVTVLSPKGERWDTRGYECIEGIHIYRYSMWEAKRGGTLAYLLEYGQALVMMSLITLWVFFRHGFRTIHAANPPDLLFLVALPYKLFGVRYVFDQHDPSPETYIQKKQGHVRPGMVKALRFLERLSYCAANLVITTNESIGALARSRGGCQASRVSVVRNAPRREEVQHIEPDMALKQGKPFLIVYVGVMGSQDGVDHLLQAVSVLCRRRPQRDFRLCLIGGGDELEKMRAYAGELGIAEQVEFLGMVYDKSRVFQAIATGDVCVCPDPNTPTNDLLTLIKQIEYMALGKPVVAFDLVEVRRSGADAALYADDDEAFAELIDRLLEDAELRKTLGERGRKRFEEELCWERSAENLLNAYAALMSQAHS